MTHVGISITFVDGVYRGRDSNESPESLPGLDRVYSALVAASHRAGVHADTALRWLEDNPPDVAVIPDHFPLSSSAMKLYRRTEVVTADKGEYAAPSTDFGYGSVMGGNLEFGWEAVPSDVSQTLSEVVSEVAYIGNSDSSVIATWGELGVPTHRRGTPEDWFGSSGAITMARPVTGRLDELSERHRRATEAPKRYKELTLIPKSSNVNNERKALAEKSRDYRRKLSATTWVPFIADTEVERTGPWNRAVWLPLLEEVVDANRAKVAGHLHRALVKVADQSMGQAPLCLVGKFPDGVQRPANNVSIQVIPAGVGVKHSQSSGGDSDAGVLVLVPSSASDADASIVLDAAFALRGTRVALGAPVEVDPLRWWAGAPHGERRVWETYPLAVSEKVGVSASLAAATAVRHAFRDHPSVGDVEVLRASRNDRGNVADYVHRTSRTPLKGGGETPVRYGMFSAVLDLSPVLPDTAVSAIGQSRHFGGGLLIPRNIVSKG